MSLEVVYFPAGVSGLGDRRALKRDRSERLAVCRDRIASSERVLALLPVDSVRAITLREDLEGYRRELEALENQSV